MIYDDETYYSAIFLCLDLINFFSLCNISKIMIGLDWNCELSKLR